MIRTLLRLLPTHSRGRVGTHLTLTVVSVLLRATGVVLLVPLIAALFGPAPSDAWPWVAGLVAATVVGWAVDWRVAGIGFELGFGLLDSGQHTVADRLSQVRLTWFDAENTATARQSIAATGPDLVGLLIYLVTPVIGAFLLPLAIGLGLLPISAPLGGAALALFPVLLGAYWASGRLGRAADRAANQANSEFTERIVEFARTQHALRAARRVDPERSQVGAALAAQHSSLVRLLMMQIPGQLIFGLASQLALLTLAGTTVFLAVSGQLAIPEAIALVVVIVRYLEPFTVLAELSGGVTTSITTLERLRAVLEAPLTGQGSAQYAAAAGPTIELRDVSFRYAPDEASVLDGLRLRLEPGTTTAIVGPSGSGKSTVLALLAGLHQPTGGAILVDGTDAATLDTESRRGLVSMVFQQPYLFDGSIEENVLAGQPTASRAAREAVAELARVQPIVDRLQGGWQAPVGEGGGVLSGGERQRVSIARALLKPASLLLLDEATSALDTENEAAITAALTADPIPRTRVIVAHRLASIRTADRVLFLEDGRVVEDGTVEELLSADGRFAEFWRQQDAATGWRLGT